MIIESGVLVALGLLFTFFKLAWRTRLNMLGRPLAMDLVVFIGLNALHWGTFSGVMVAAVGALVCSAMLSLGRKTFGYIERGPDGPVYYPGFINVIDRINK
jgi:hypothetical protein